MGNDLSSIIDQWASFYYDPVGFAYHVIGFNPQRWQRDVLNSLYSDNGRCRTAVKSCHNPGKTALDAIALLHFLATRPYPKVLATAPTAHQLDDNLWPEVHKWLHQSKGQLWRWFEWRAQRVVFKPDPVNWFAAARVAKVQKGQMGSEAVGLQGRHADHVLWIVDEGSGVDDAIWGAIEGSLASDKEVVALVTGNPNVPRGFFYDAFHKHREHWNLHTISYKDSPQVSNRWAEALIAMYGEDHPWVQVKAFGEFPTEVEFGLIPLWAWERATDPSFHADLLMQVEEHSKKVLGVDVADMGDDRSVIARATGPVVHSLKKFAKLDTMKIADWVMAEILDFGPDVVVIDADGGYGAGVASAVMKRYKHVIRWHGGGHARKPKRFLNARAELGWAMRMALMEGRAAVPVDEQAGIQATTMRYEPLEDGRTKLMSKKELRAKFGLPSPDEFDAISYALAPSLVAASVKNPAHSPERPRDGGRHISRSHLVS